EQVRVDAPRVDERRGVGIGDRGARRRRVGGEPAAAPGRQREEGLRGHPARIRHGGAASGPRSGKVTTNRAPPVGARSGATRRSPPCSIASLRAIASPSPVPVDLVVTYGSKIFSRASAATPWP